MTAAQLTAPGTRAMAAARATEPLAAGVDQRRGGRAEEALGGRGNSVRVCEGDLRRLAAGRGRQHPLELVVYLGARGDRGLSYRDGPERVRAGVAAYKGERSRPAMRGSAHCAHGR
jgi:hypothetical protein